jgi:hypothetical protein
MYQIEIKIEEILALICQAMEYGVVATVGFGSAAGDPEFLLVAARKPAATKLFAMLRSAAEREEVSPAPDVNLPSGVAFQFLTEDARPFTPRCPDCGRVFENLEELTGHLADSQCGKEPAK